MCTVTYIPLSENSFVLTSNRDEHISRLPSSKVETNIINTQKVIFPKDGNAGGTWICASESGRLVCLLNGAFFKHKRTPPYRKSRGILMLESFNYNSPTEFKNKYDFNNIEPFTLIFCETSPLTLTELRWDGKTTHLRNLPINNHIWSSPTLYDNEISNQREQWFKEWFTEHEISENSAKLFHKIGGKSNNENNLFMCRANGMKTVSTTQVIYNNNSFNMGHENYITLEKSYKSIHNNVEEKV